MKRFVVALVAMVISAAACTEPEAMSDEERAAALARRLVKSGWTQAEPSGIRFDRVGHRYGPGHLRRAPIVTLYDLVDTKKFSGPRARVAYHVYPTRWHVLGEFLASKRAYSGRSRVPEWRITTDERMRFCIESGTGAECFARSGNVLVHAVLNRFTPRMEASTAEAELLAELAQEHLHAVQVGMKAEPPLPLVVPGD